MPALPATACRGRQWDPADRFARAARCHLATRPASLRRARASTSTQAAVEPGGMRVVPATPLPAVAGQDPRGTPDLRDLPDLSPMTSSMAGTPTSSGRRTTRSGRPVPRARRALAAPELPPDPQIPPGPPTLAARPRPVTSATPADAAPADVYVYRDTGGQPDEPAAPYRDRTSMTPPTGTTCPGRAPGEIPPRACPRRPAAHSSPWCLPPTRPAPRPDSPPPSTTPNPRRRDAAHTDDAPASAADDGQEDTAYAHASKLEQIKDLYLTAEAIGEANVDKHFDQLLAQQRELISEYFKHSNAARPAAGLADQAGTEPAGGAGQEPGAPGDTGPPAARRA